MNIARSFARGSDGEKSIAHSAARAVSPQWATHVNGWLLLLPAAVLLITFTHYPAVATIIDSLFSTPKGGRPAVFVGLDNYQAMFEDPIFWRALNNNIVYATATIPLTIGLAMVARPLAA